MGYLRDDAKLRLYSCEHINLTCSNAAVEICQDHLILMLGTFNVTSHSEVCLNRH